MAFLHKQHLITMGGFIYCTPHDLRHPPRDIDPKVWFQYCNLITFLKKLGVHK